MASKKKTSSKKPPCVAVLTADIIGSTQYNAAKRQRIDRVLTKAFAELILAYPKAFLTKPAFRITAGDEFQCVFAQASESFKILTHLRCVCATSGLDPMLAFRASIGLGSVTIGGRASSYEQDGEAFVRSRRGLDQLEKEKRTRWTKITTGNVETDAALDIVLLLLDQKQRDWTVAQWEAVKWLLAGKSRMQIAKRLKVAHQNVSKRLAAAGWDAFKASSHFIAERLTEACHPD